MNNNRIFIHSLFRSGSTYFFSKLKEEGSIKSFQEPIHELVCIAAENHDLDVLRLEEEDRVDLRHPGLSSGYYSELSDLGLEVLSSLDIVDVYGNYFENKISHNLSNYINTLLASSDQVVIQECRTSNRIKGMKEKFGGVHFFLLRDPFSQWSSYQVNDYFNRINLMVLANSELNYIKDFLRKLEFPDLSSSDFMKNYRNLDYVVLGFKESYKAFYILWVLSLYHAIKYSDFIIDMRRLSNDGLYKKTIKQQFDNIGVHLKGFDDCSIPFLKLDPNSHKTIKEIEIEVLAGLALESSLSGEVLNTVECYSNSFLNSPADELNQKRLFSLVVSINNAMKKRMASILNDKNDRTQNIAILSAEMERLYQHIDAQEKLRGEMSNEIERCNDLIKSHQKLISWKFVKLLMFLKKKVVKLISIWS